MNKCIYMLSLLVFLFSCEHNDKTNLLEGIHKVSYDLINGYKIQLQKDYYRSSLLKGENVILEDIFLFEVCDEYILGNVKKKIHTKGQSQHVFEHFILNTKTEELLYPLTENEYNKNKPFTCEEGRKGTIMDIKQKIIKKYW